MVFPTGWGWSAPITIPALKISGTNTNFPVLLTEANFPTAMIDGGVNSALNGGGDVRFSEDSAGLTQLPCCIPTGGFITGATPKIHLYVNIPTLTNAADKIIYVWYKNPGQVQPLVTSLYGRNATFVSMQAMFLLGYDSINLQGDSINDLVLYNNPTVIQGRNGLVRHFDGITQYARTGPLANFNSLPAYSIGMGWKLLSPIPALHRVFELGGYAAPYSEGFSLEAGNTYIFWRTNNNYSSQIVNNIPGLNTWSNLSMGTNNATASTDFYNDGTNFYHDAVSVRTVLHSTTLTIGEYNSGTGFATNIDVDYFYVLKSKTTQNWLTTEYNNQSSPSTFATAGIPMASSGGGGTNVIVTSQPLLITPSNATVVTPILIVGAPPAPVAFPIMPVALSTGNTPASNQDIVIVPKRFDQLVNKDGTPTTLFSSYLEALTNANTTIDIVEPYYRAMASIAGLRAELEDLKIVHNVNLIPIDDNLQKQINDLEESMIGFVTGLVNQINLTGFLKNMVEDTTPQLGGILDAQNNKIINIGTPTLNNDVTSKSYVDTNDNLKLNLTGGTLSGILINNNTTDSTSVSTGSIHTVGGIGVAKTINVGGTLIVSNNSGGFLARFNITNATANNGIYVKGIVVGSTSDSVYRFDDSTGEKFRIDGTGGAIFSGIINNLSIVNSISVSTGSIHTAGGIGVLKNIIGGSIIKTGSGITSARPTPSGPGSGWFDTTIGKPIWYNGTIWVDAQGTAI